LGALTGVEDKRVSKQFAVKSWEGTRINQIPVTVTRDKQQGLVFRL